MRNSFNADHLYNSLNAIRAEKDNDDIEQQLKDYDILLHAMWELLKSKGFIESDLEEAINYVIEKRRMAPSYERKFVVKCPKCDRNLQRINNFQMKCMYCNSFVTISPYAQYDKADIEAKVDTDDDI